MKYFEVITSDTTWTCPKTGMWKIIAVGGGSSGVVRGYSGSYNTVTKDVTLYSNGGDTLFGTDLTANGGIVVNGYKGHHSNTVYTDFCYMTGGAGGYNLNTYGGTGAYSFSNSNKSNSEYRAYISSPSTGNGGSIGCQGLGYGAGGALNFAIYIGGSTDYFCLESGMSSAGVLNETVIDISANTSYTCTIGKGGSITQEELNTFKTDVGYGSTYFLPSDVGYGRDGCIVVQYVGESY